MGALLITKGHFEGYGQDTIRYFSVVAYNIGHDRSVIESNAMK